MRFDLADTPLSSSSTKRKLSDSMTSDNVKKTKQRRVEQLAKRQKKAKDVCKYLDVEAEASTADSDDEDEDEDDNGLSQDSFINDSSQLGFTQDVFDSLDCDKLQSSTSREIGEFHRQVDMMKDQDETFATPVLRRRRNENTELSHPSSEKKLGEMHFIRSVIEHHRQGGDADELERGYHEIMGKHGIAASQDSESRSVLQIADQTNATTSIIVSQRPPVPSTSTLTAAQLERIRKNKEKALLLRQNKLSKL